MPNNGSAASEKYTTQRPGARARFGGAIGIFITGGTLAPMTGGWRVVGVSLGTGLDKASSRTPRPEASSESSISVQSKVSLCAHHQVIASTIVPETATGVIHAKNKQVVSARAPP